MRDTPSCLPASAHAPNPAPTKARYVQFLSVTNYPKLGFIYASEEEDDDDQILVDGGARATASGMIMSTVPITSAAEIFRHFVRNCELIWCHRHTVTVTGTVYDVGDFRVRLGELRQMQPQARVRGTIMEIEWRGPSVITAALSSPSSLNNRKAANDGDNDIADSMDIDTTKVTEETPYIPTDAEINTEYTQIAHLIRDFWAHLAITQHIITDAKQQAAIRESILIADVGREVKLKLSQRRQNQSDVEGGGQVGWQEREIRRRQKRREALALDRSWGGSNISQQQEEEEEELEGGVDLARQYMELFRFNR
jgi:TATA-binding related factor (TRF) of subunit 20 of Mediator complex